MKPHEQRGPIDVLRALVLSTFLILVVAALLFAAWAPRHMAPTVPPDLQLEADMRSLNGSGVTGTATAADAGANAVAVQIFVSWKDYPEMAAAVASGSCDAPGPNRFTLESVRRGSSLSEVPGTLDSIRGLLVLTYRSLSTAGPLTSCGMLD